MSINAYKDLPVKELAQLFKLLSEPNRIRILRSMGLECTPVTAIIEDTGLSQTNVSFHLRALREAGIVKGDRRGGYVFYCLYDTELLNLLTELEHWQKQNQLTIDKEAVGQQ